MTTERGKKKTMSLMPRKEESEEGGNLSKNAVHSFTQYYQNGAGGGNFRNQRAHGKLTFPAQT